MIMECRPNKKIVAQSCILLVCWLIVLIAGIYILVVDGPQLSTVLGLVAMLLILGYLLLDNVLYYKNFKLTLTEKEIILINEYGKEQRIALSDQENIYITRVKTGPVIVLGEKKYFVYGRKLDNYDGLVDNLEHLGVFTRKEIVKANTSNVDRLKDEWGRTKEK